MECVLHRGIWGCCVEVVLWCDLLWWYWGVVLMFSLGLTSGLSQSTCLIALMSAYQRYAKVIILFQFNILFAENPLVNLSLYNHVNVNRINRQIWAVYVRIPSTRNVSTDANELLNGEVVDGITHY